MTMIEVTDMEAEILDKMRKLEPHLQEYFLAYLSSIEAGQEIAINQRKTIEGELSSEFIRDVFALNIALEDVEEMERAIEEAFESPEAHFPEVDLDA